jgi:hypothetical protein
LHQGSHSAPTVLGIALRHRLRNLPERCRVPRLLHLLKTPLTAHSRCGVKKKFYGCIWKNNRADITPFYDQVRLTTQLPQLCCDHLPHLWHSRHR